MKFSQKQIQIIHQAQATIKEKIGNMERSGIKVKFVIDRENAVVVAIKQRVFPSLGVTKVKDGNFTWFGEIIGVGVSRCSKEDRFVQPIGQIIALERASNKRPQKEYLHFTDYANQADITF